MKLLTSALFLLLAAAAPARAQTIAGDWQGTLAIGGSPDQGATGIPVGAVTRNSAKLDLEMKQLGGGFSGTIDAGLTTIDGTWTQGGNSLPLVLKRVRR